MSFIRLLSVSSVSSFLTLSLVVPIFTVSVAIAQQLEQAKPWLGVGIAPHPKGILVENVLAGTPAEKGGIKSGDIITAIDDLPQSDVRKMIEFIGSKGIGNTVKIDLLRGTDKLQLKMALEARPEMLEIAKSKLLDKSAPDFKLTAVHGLNSGNLADHKGHVTLIQFWATWCPACRASHGVLSKAAEELGPKGLRILAISAEESPVIQEYLKKTGAKFTALADPDGKVSNEYNVPALPMMVVINPEGNVKHVAIGGGRYLDETIAKIESLLTNPKKNGE